MNRHAYHHGDLRRALLVAARRLVEREGPSRVGLRALAREARVSPAAPYHHFADRDAILAALAAEGFAELAEAMRRGTRRASRARLQRLQAAGVAYVRFAARNPELFRLMFGGLLADRSAYPDLRQSADEAFGVLHQLLGPTRGSAARGRPGPAALTAWSTVHGLAVLLIDGRLGTKPGDRKAANLAREVTRVLGAGLRSFATPAAG